MAVAEVAAVGKQQTKDKPKCRKRGGCGTEMAAATAAGGKFEGALTAKATAMMQPAMDMVFDWEAIACGVHRAPHVDSWLVVVHALIGVRRLLR